MATYYPPSNNHQRDVFQSSYDSYQESPCPPVDMMYQNQTSTDNSFLQLLSGNMQPNPQILSQVKDHNTSDDERNLQYQELSLSLGMQIPSSSMDLPSFQYNYLNTHLQDPHDHGSHGSQTHKVENVDYLSFDLVGKNGQCSVSDTYDVSYGLVSGRILDSKYLKPSQELLEEVANLREALRQLKINKLSNLHTLRVDDKKNSKFTPHESTTTSSGELSASEKQDLQNKVTRLFSFLDEVTTFIFQEYPFYLFTLEYIFLIKSFVFEYRWIGNTESIANNCKLLKQHWMWCLGVGLQGHTQHLHIEQFLAIFGAYVMPLMDKFK